MIKRFSLLTAMTICALANAIAQTALPTSWGFNTPNISNPPNGWTLNQGTNGNLTYTGTANAVGDGVAARLDATGEFIKISFADVPGELSYFLRGTGISPAPSFTGVFSIQESADDVNYTNLREFTTASPAPGSMTRFTNQPAAASRYIRFFYTNKLAGSNISLDSVWIKAAGPVATATINIKQGANNVVNQATVVVGTNALTNFTIENKGTAQALTIDSIRFEGTAASDYSIQGTAPTTIAALGNQILGIAFAPSANGSRLGILKIYNNDPAKNPYIINLYGIGGTTATEPTAAPGALTTSNTTSYGFRLSLANATPKPEKYMVLRKKGNSISDAPSDGQSYKVGDRIGESVVAYVGDSAFSSLKPTYIFASTEYAFKAFSFNGPAGFENYLTTSSTSANVTTTGKNPGNYYDGIDPAQSNFLTQLSAKINPHDTVFYSLYASRLMAGFVARDTTGGQKVVNCVYTGIPYIYSGAFNWWTGQASNPAILTREHTFAQSWMPSNMGAGWPNGANGKEMPEYNDMHHLFPADQINGNGQRSNLPFGNVVNASFTSPSGFGKKGTNANGQTVWEPKADHKGDLARSLMYMSVCYNGISGLNWKFPANQSPAVILQWNNEDQPSDFEIARHEYIFSQQRNRNPFIDNPEWATRINFANMTYITTGVEGITFEHALATYPNPAENELHVDATLIFTRPMAYTITDTKGAAISHGTITEPQSVVQMPTRSGMYFLNLETENGRVVTRVLRK